MVSMAEPTLADSRSRNADFMEITALLSRRGKAGKTTLLSVLDFAEDPLAGGVATDDETGEPLNERIAEQDRERFVTRVFDELSYRERCLGVSYPFSVGRGTLTFDASNGNFMDFPGRTTYLFCLIASTIREKRFQPIEKLSVLTQRIAGAFQICACLAAGAYIGGEVSSFGFPRATGDSFLPALRNTYRRFGAGSVRNDGEVPAGLPTELKDGGIDVVAWRDLPDRMPGKIYLLGQCASGENWRSKSVVEYIGQLHGAWFSQVPARHSIPAMFIPFPFYHDIQEHKQAPFHDTVHNRFWFEEQRYGIIFDRLRVAHFAGVCMKLPEKAKQKVDGAEQFEVVAEWIAAFLQLVQAEAS